MATYYTTAAKVGYLLNKTFSGSTTPTSTIVEGIINRMEDYIDNATGHAWRAVTVTEEIQSMGNTYQYSTGFPVNASHRSIRTLASISGDKVEIWEGSSWVDYLATEEEGREKDYWVDYQKGIFHFFTRFRFPAQVRLTYRYGESSVPGDIEDICTKLVAIDLLNMEDCGMQTIEGGDNVSLQSKIEIWRKDIDHKLQLRKEFHVIKTY